LHDLLDDAISDAELLACSRSKLPPSARRKRWHLHRHGLREDLGSTRTGPISAMMLGALAERT